TGLAFLIRFQQGSWLAPSAFFSLVWAVLVWLALGLASDVPLSALALWWIVLSVVAVWIGGAFATGVTKRTGQGSETVSLAAGVAAVLTTKATLLFCLVIMAGSFLASRVAFSSGRDTMFCGKRLVGILGLGVVLLPGFVFLQMQRYGYAADNPLQILDVLTRL